MYKIYVVQLGSPGFSMCLYFIDWSVLIHFSRYEEGDPLKDASRDREQHPEAEHKVPAPPQPVLHRVFLVHKEAGDELRPGQSQAQSGLVQRDAGATVPAQCSTSQ